MKPYQSNKGEQRKLSVVDRYFWKWGSEIKHVMIWRWRGDAINMVYVTIKGVVSECTLLKGTSALFQKCLSYYQQHLTIFFPSTSGCRTRIWSLVPFSRRLTQQRARCCGQVFLTCAILMLGHFLVAMASDMWEMEMLLGWNCNTFLWFTVCPRGWCFITFYSLRGRYYRIYIYFICKQSSILYSHIYEGYNTINDIS